jgi:hypothetical protein
VITTGSLTSNARAITRIERFPERVITLSTEEISQALQDAAPQQVDFEAAVELERPWRTDPRLREHYWRILGDADQHIVMVTSSAEFTAKLAVLGWPGAHDVLVYRMKEACRALLYERTADT